MVDTFKSSPVVMTTEAERKSARGKYLAKYLFSVHMKDEEIAIDNGIARFPFCFSSFCSNFLRFIPFHECVVRENPSCASLVRFWGMLRFRGGENTIFFPVDKKPRKCS